MRFLDYNRRNNEHDSSFKQRYIYRVGRYSLNGLGTVSYWADRQTYLVWVMTDKTKDIMLSVQKTFSIDEAKDVLKDLDDKCYDPHEEAVVELVTAEILQGDADDDWTS